MLAEARYAQLGAGALLARDVGEGGGILADEDDGQTRRDSALLEGGGPGGQLAADVLGGLLAVNDARRHGASRSVKWMPHYSLSGPGVATTNSRIDRATSSQHYGRLAFARFPLIFNRFTNEVRQEVRL